MKVRAREEGDWERGKGGGERDGREIGAGGAN